MSSNVSIELSSVAPGASWTGAGELDRRALLAEILAQISREALQAEGLELTLRSIVDCIVQHLPVEIASILLLDESATHFIREVWAGDLPLDDMATTSWPVSRGAAGRCARVGAAQLIEDVAQDPDYVVGNPNVRSEYLVPIRHRQRILGVLNLESMHTDFFTTPVCAMFDAVAAQIGGAIYLTRVVADLEEANRCLRQLSLIDGLTGAANRRAFDLNLEQAWQQAEHDGSLLALLLLDADWFKRLNDTEGHQHGDACLRLLARLCSETVQGRDHLVARYGGEELAVLLPRTGLAEATRLAESIRERVAAQRMSHKSSPLLPYVTVSIGASATRPRPQRGASGLVAAADRALYAAKRAGRNRVAQRRCS